MSFDFSTLVTDRTQADVSRVQELASKIRSGTASESDLAEFNSAAMKGAYNYTDLNRVTAAMEALKAKLEGYGYSVPGYQCIKVPHVLPEPEPTGRLPKGYTELTYIESTGTQYINTGVPHSLTRKIKLDATLRYTNVSGTQIMGFSGNAGYAIGVANGKWWDMSGSSIAATVETMYSISLFTNGTTFQKTVNNTTVSGSRAEYSQAKNMLLFAAWDTMSASVVSYHFHSKMYDARIYVDGVLVRDFIPCINPDGAVGLYDLVTKAFFGNSGTGSFVAGAIPRELPEGYTQVEYIQSSGTQYIDTGFKPNQDTRVVCKAQYTDISGSFCLFGARYSVSERRYDFLVTSKQFFSEYNSNSGSYTTLPATTDVLEIDKNKNVTTINGVTHSTHNYVAFQAPCNMLLFAENTNNSPHLQAKAKIYCFQIYDNGVLARDYVPCKNSGGVFGLYDLANDVFYQNAGSGTFAAGEEVVAPSKASVVAVSDDVTEYDLYTWYEFDWPTTEAMTIYLLNVSAIRTVLAVLHSTPNVPNDVERMMAREANDIEAILLDVYRQLTIMPTTFIPCGEALCGGDNL